MAKSSATRVAGKNKKQQLEDIVKEAVGAGKKIQLETVDFSDPNRPKTCLEVDFPILPLNLIAGPEMSSGAAKKPVYTWQKWWARRSSHVFRAMMIAGASKAPDDPAEAAKIVWDSFYGNHQSNEQFRRLKVADIFMGGGTTIVEGSRLGMQLFGNDLNPVAWFVVKNELLKVDPDQVALLLAKIEADVKPQIRRYFSCDCPRGHRGQWKNILTGELMDKEFSPHSLPQAEIAQFSYKGPEVIYTFWAKHGPCQATGCEHRTPIMSSPVIALKSLTVKSWQDRECKKCRGTFDIEQHEARMAPAALFVCAPGERSYAVIQENGDYFCPHCGDRSQDLKAKVSGESIALGKSKNKSVELTLLVHPNWLKGSPGINSDGTTFGGSVSDDSTSTAAWNSERQKTLKHIEVRGVLPEQVVCPDTGLVFDTGSANIPKKSTFVCMDSTCGKQWDVLESVKRSKKSGPVAVYAVQGYCAECDEQRLPYSGRFFDIPDLERINASNAEWENRKETDLATYWPRGEVPFGFMTSMNNGGIANHGLTHWWTMFTPLQLLIHSQILKSIASHPLKDEAEVALGVWQKYVQHDCMLCFWDEQQDCLAPHFANNNYHPKNTPVSNNPFSKLGRGNWQSCVATYTEAEAWIRNPWDLVRGDAFQHLGVTSKTIKLPIGDAPISKVVLECHTASDCVSVESRTIDLVITDPPFGGLLHYSELADFYHAWLRLVLKERYPEKFEAEYCPKALEAVANRARQPKDADGFYKRVLTECWREAGRILKESGILAFTFHHSEDEPWVAVLESLFEAGFYLEAAYPIRSDETKGEGGKPGTFGSQLIEYDIIHVCRKRVAETQEISWARLRRRIMQDVRQLQQILEHHQQAGLAEADLQVIRRGKALEYYSKHYGKVYVEKGRDFSVKEALAGINQLLDDQHDSTADVPPVDAEPYTRQFLRLFADALSLPRDQLQKYLRGTGVSPNEFLDRGWCTEKGKVFTMTHPLDQAMKWKGAPRKGLGKDLDQAMFLIGACYESSGINVNETLNNPNFVPHPALLDILDWFSRHGGDDTMKGASQTARQLYKKWLSNNEPKVKQVQQTLFDLMEDGE